ncbi:MAG: hypothetical protein ACK5QX_04690, partial [bacterium]
WNFFQPEGSGPRNPVKDFVECGELDRDLERLYREKGYRETSWLTREQAEELLNEFSRLYPQTNQLYPPGSEMLDTAERGVREHWTYGVFGG